MNERERELKATIWFLTVACLALLVVLGINLQGLQDGGDDWTNQPTLRYPHTDSCGVPTPPSPCLENLP
jgi:ABC-type transporter Mla subunit MlaD